MPAKLKFQRVLLKISGEGLCKPGSSGLDGDEVDLIAEEIKAVHDTDAQVVIVVGGGNFIRGRTLVEAMPHIHEATAHYMGMVATVLNALTLQDALEGVGVPTRVQSAIPIDRVCEKFVRRRCVRHLEKSRVVILAGGTGTPFVTTDTCAAQRAVELDCNALLKATQVDGIYSADPNEDPAATRYATLEYDEAIRKELGIMDTAAFVLCRDHRLPIIVFRLKECRNMSRVVLGDPIGTRVG